MGQRGSYALGIAVSRVRMEVLLNSEQSVGASARTVELDHRRHRELEQTSGGASQCRICGAAEEGSKCPQRASVRVFGSLVFHPTVIVAEEVSKPFLLWIEGMLQERQIPEGPIWVERLAFGGQLDTRFLHAQLVQQNSKNKCAGVVVGGVSLGPIGNGKDRMLQHSGVVGECIHVIEFQVGKLIQEFLGRAGRKLNPGSLHAIAADPGKTLHVTLGNFLPDHVAGEQVGAFAHGMPQGWCSQELDCLLCDGVGVLEGNQGAATVV